MTEKPPQRSCIAVIFGGLFAFVGSIILAFGVYDYSETIETYRWQAVPAQLRSIEVAYPKQAPRDSDNNPFELTVDYEYEVDGKPYSGDRLQRKAVSNGSYQKLADLRWQLIKDEIGSAYVNANDATEAILKRESLGPGLIFILFPLPFLVIGIAVMLAGMGWFLPSSAGKTVSSDSRMARFRGSAFARGSLNRDNFGGLLAKVLGAIFMLVGLGVGYGLVYLPITKARNAKSWVETPCTVLWSRVEVHDGDDSDSYSADVFYEYEYDGETHRSNEYSFMGNTSSSNRSAAREIVREFSASKKATCFVDPSMPWRAVIVRDASQVGFWVLIPTIFFLVGAIVFFVGLKANFN